MKFTILTFILLSSLQSFSTPQTKDVLVYKGKNYNLNEYYLEAYFKKYPDKKPKSNIQSSDLWRGYLAIFLVLENQIYLTDLKIRVKDNKKNEMLSTKWKSVFNDFSPNKDKFLIDWITDLELLSIGEPIDYEKNYGILYNDYNLLEFKNGKIINSYIITLKEYNKVFKNKPYIFLKDEELEYLKEKIINQRN